MSIRVELGKQIMLLVVSSFGFLVLKIRFGEMPSTCCAKKILHTMLKTALLVSLYILDQNGWEKSMLMFG